ncbi:MAG: hypothetical protein ACFE95_23375, partial [Candidatus Hodarchaeota archaeon]
KRVSPKKIPTKKEPDSLEKFLIETIAEYFTNSQTKTISIMRLGTLLHKKSPNWKKKYEVKQLKDALESLGDNIKISGEQTALKIELL